MREEGSMSIVITGTVEFLTGRTPRSLREVFEAHRGELMQEVAA
jgi:hypothetical protein